MTTVNNPEDPIEVAWADYAAKFIFWQWMKEKHQNQSAHDGKEMAESKNAHDEANVALWHYFEVYDSDQVKRFGSNKVKVKI